MHERHLAAARQDSVSADPARSAADVAGQCRLSLQPVLRALPRQCRAEPHRGDGRRRPSISCSTFLERRRIATLDITGGAPELNANFRRLVTAARDMGVKVMDRHNLTVQEQPGQEDLPEFLAGNQVEIVASMPCYLQDNVDKQRGKGVYDGSIRALQRLNALGYGREGSGLTLNLVYNPLGPRCRRRRRSWRPTTSACWASASASCSTACSRSPTCRSSASARSCCRRASSTAISTSCSHAHRDENLDGVMCRNLLSVDYRGYVYDCDFNQMLDLPLTRGGASACICPICSTTTLPTIRSVSPATASAAPPAKARAAAAR